MADAAPDRRLVLRLRIGRRCQYPLYPQERRSVRRPRCPPHPLQQREHRRDLLARNDRRAGLSAQITRGLDFQTLDHRAGNHARGRVEDADDRYEDKLNILNTKYTK